MTLPYTDTTFFDMNELDAWVTMHETQLLNSAVPMALPSRWWAQHAMMVPNAAKKIKVYTRASIPRMRVHTGRPLLQRPQRFVIDYERDDPKDLFFGATLAQLRGGDLEGFSIAPEEADAAANKEADIGFGELLGNAQNTVDWTGKRFLVLNTAADADKKYINPGERDDETLRYTNLRENFAFNGPNISILVGELYTRQGYDFQPLMYESREIKMWVPVALAMEAKQLTGRIEVIFDSGTGGTSRAFQLVDYQVVPTMPSTMWGVSITPSSPSELPFVYAMGNNASLMPEIDKFPTWQREPGKDMTPHRETRVYTSQSVRYEMAQEVGYGIIQNESYHLLEARGLNMAFTGSAGVT